MKKTQGSELFGTNVMTAEECLILMEVMNKNGSSDLEKAMDMELIDDLLCLQRTRIISRAVSYTKTGKIRKDASFSSAVNKRLDRYIQEKGDFLTE